LCLNKNSKNKPCFNEKKIPDCIYCFISVNSIKIYDATGKLVYQSFNPSKEKISIANLSNGLYAMSFSTNKGLGLRKLLIYN